MQRALQEKQFSGITFGALLGLLVPWIVTIGALGFLAAWLVTAILERTGLARHVWHLPLCFLALVILFSSLIGAVFFP